MIDEVVLPGGWDNESDHSVAYDAAVVDRGVTDGRWTDGVRQYTLRWNELDFPDYRALRDFYYARRGYHRGFLLDDVFDRTSAADGTSTPAATDQLLYLDVNGNLRLAKRYGTRVRYIIRPVPGSVVFAPSGPTIDYATGIVTGGTTGTTCGFRFLSPSLFVGDMVEDLRYAQLPSVTLGVEECKWPSTT